MMTLPAGLGWTKPAAGGGGGPGAHDYWRLLITLPDGSGSFCGLTELELRATPGGSDLTNPTFAVGSVDGSSAINGDNLARFAFDDSLTTGWLSATAATSWVSWNFAAFGTAKEVLQIAITGSWNAPDASPRNFELQWSDDASAWTTCMTVTGETGWTGSGDTRLFNV